MQFSDAADNFLRFCAVERQLSEHTVKAYASDLVDFGKWLPARLALSDVSSASLKGYLEELIGKRNLTAATVRRRFACLRAFFRRLAHFGNMVDPFTGWELKLPRRRRLPRTLTRVETSSLLYSLRGIDLPKKNTPDIALRIAVGLMISTGLRVGELCKLRIEDISPDCSQLRVHGKGSRERIAYITDVDFKRDLQQFVESRRGTRDAVVSLFVNRHGLAMKPQSIRSKLRRYASEVGLVRRITPHMLRHTAATLLIETGVDIRFVQKLLGHSSIATTEIYTHVSDEALRTTLQRANILGTLGKRTEAAA